MTDHAELYAHLTAVHALHARTLAGADTARLTAMHQHEHAEFGADLDHTHDPREAGAAQPGPLPVAIPAALASDVLDWVADRAACAHAEDDPHAEPWWAVSDDAAADLVQRFAELIAPARSSG